MMQGILFDAESVRGLLTCAQCGKLSVEFPCACRSTDFTKTQTRRVVRRMKMHADYGKPVWDEAWVDTGYEQYGNCCLKVPFRGGEAGETVHRHWPNYVKDDKCYVREPLYTRTTEYAGGARLAHYLADYQQVPGPILWRWQKDKIPSMFCPKEATRLYVEMETPHCERLQDISDEDCLAEGLQREWDGRHYWYYATGDAEGGYRNHKMAYRERITAINGLKVWVENWRVWKYEFRRIAPPEEQNENNQRG